MAVGAGVGVISGVASGSGVDSASIAAVASGAVSLLLVVFLLSGESITASTKRTIAITVPVGCFILFEIELIINKIKTTKAVIFQLQDER